MQTGKNTEWDDIWLQRSFIQKILQVIRKLYSSHFLKLVRPYLNGHSRFLEIGCGSGSFVIEMAKHVNKSVGIDISDNAVSFSQADAKRNNSKAAFYKASCYELPFEDDSFDIVWSQGFIQEIDRPIDCLIEQIRVCSQNGVVLATVPARDSLLWLMMKATRPKPLNFLWPWPEQRFYNAEDLFELGMKSGLKAKISKAGIFRELLILELKR